MASTSPLDDHRLLSLIQSGNVDSCRQARDELLNDQRYLAFVQRMVRRRLEARQMLFPDQANFRADAEFEVLVELLETVYSVEQLPRNMQRGSGFDPAQGTLRNWLWRQADNRTRDWIRRALRHEESDQQSESSHQAATETAAGEPTTPHTPSAGFQRFHQALDQLSPMEHACVLLRFLPYLRLDPTDRSDRTDPTGAAPVLRFAVRTADIRVLARVAQRDIPKIRASLLALDETLEQRRRDNPDGFESLARCEARVQLLHHKQAGYRRDSLFYRRRLLESGATEDQLDRLEKSAGTRTVQQIWDAHGRQHTDWYHYEDCCQRLARALRQLHDAREKLARSEEHVCPTSDEIGQFLGKSKTAIDPPLSRGRRKLRDVLEETASHTNNYT